MLSLQRSRNRQTGIGLLELMLSLAIIAILLIMATRYFTEARQGQRVSSAISMVKAVQSATSEYVMATNSNANVDIKTLISDGYLDTNTFAGSDGNGEGADPWGGRITAAPGTTTKTSVVVTMSQVGESACNALVNDLQNSVVDSSSNPPTCSASNNYTFTGEF